MDHLFCPLPPYHKAFSVAAVLSLLNPYHLAEPTWFQSVINFPEGRQESLIQMQIRMGSDFTWIKLFLVASDIPLPTLRITAL